MSKYKIEPVAKSLTIEYDLGDSRGIVIETSTDTEKGARLTFIDVLSDKTDALFVFDDLNDIQDFTNIVHDAVAEFKYEFNKITNNE